jgi:hypothetical protein
VPGLCVCPRYVTLFDPHTLLVRNLEQTGRVRSSLPLMPPCAPWTHALPVVLGQCLWGNKVFSLVGSERYLVFPFFRQV